MARKYVSFNPYTEQLLKEYKSSTPKEITEAIARSHTAFKRFSKLSFAARGEKLKNLSALFLSHKTELATHMSTEMGKPITQSLGEITKSAECCNYYAMHAENLLQSQHYPVAGECFVKYEPMGAILSIMPFNFPVWMPMKTSIPHLMAGNTVILKHAENMPQTAEFLEKLTKDAGLVDEFINLRPELIEIERMIKDHRIVGVSLTGSVRAGKIIASMAAANMKKYVMELGGNDPFLVLRDADLPKAAKALVSGRLAGCGQVCISPKRAIVSHEVYDAFVELVLQEIKNWHVGDPLNEKTVMGPMARSDLVEQVHALVSKSVAMGAKLLEGGRPASKFVYPPTLIVNVTEEMPVFIEEVFGPVVAIAKARGEADAIRIANATEYGLGAVVFSKDTNRVRNEVLPQIRSGMVFVNENCRSIVQVPFGGTKGSGTGRELGSDGIKEFCNAKTVYIG